MTERVREGIIERSGRHGADPFGGRGEVRADPFGGRGEVRADRREAP
jgi:hypothetical protein